MEKLKHVLFAILCFLLFAIPIGNVVYHRVQYKKMSETLISIDPQDITSFRIYASVNPAIRESQEFTLPDSIVSDFFLSLKDIESYSPNHDAASPEQSWSVEVITNGGNIYIYCYIPYPNGDVVVGGVRDSELFQSSLLLKWYEKHSHRWLGSEN